MENITQLYKVLSEQMRLRILVLLTHGELCVCDLMEILEEPQSKVSRHVAYLKNSGLIKSKRVGMWNHYFIREPLEGLVASHVDFLKKELSGLDWARNDVERMKEVQAKKLCEASDGRTPVSRKNNVENKIKDMTKTKGKRNS